MVYALVPGPGGSLWAGTNGGQARLDKDGHWQTYTQTSTNGGLPNDLVWALAPGPGPSLGRILFHLLQEYARHVGQLDIARELIDGSTGE